jgi:hypothetical protein
MTYPLKFRLPSFRDSNKLRDFLQFYPDVFEFQFNKNTYQKAWESLKLSSRRYLMVNNGQLESVSFLRYGYEQVKGWIGLGNSCHPSKVNIIAQKLAYFGYLNGFNQESMLKAIATWDEPCRPKEAYINTTKEERSNGHSLYLQQELVAYYKAHASDLDAMKAEKTSIIKPHSDRNYVFGATYATIENIEVLALLDVQNERLIADYIKDFPDGRFTLTGSTFRRMYVTHVLTNISELFEQTISKEVSKTSVLGVLGQLFSNTSKTFESVVRELDFRASEIIKLWPGIEKHHLSMLVKFKVILAEQNSEQTTEAKDALYKIAYQLIREHGEGLHACGLMNYFLEDAGFRVLDRNDEFVRSWGAHLFYATTSRVLPKEQQALYLYRIAQLRRDLIPIVDLPGYIDVTLCKKDFPLALSLIETLSSNNMDLATAYLTQHAKYLIPFLKKDTPLAIAYAGQLVVRTESQWSLRSFFSSKDDSYRQAEALASSIPIREGANYFFEKYVNAKAWDKARDLLVARKEAGLPLDSLPTAALTALSEYFGSEALRLTNEGKRYFISNDVPAAESCYRKCLAELKFALALIDSDANRFLLNVQRRMMAELILYDMQSLGKLKLERLNEARAQLMEVEITDCSTEDELYTITYTAVLENMVKCLHEKCLLADTNVIVIAAEKHRTISLDSANKIIDLIDKIILLRTSHKLLSQDRATIASLYFLKAEVISYFELEGDATMNYRHARDLEPNQPFYQLRLAEVLGHSDSKEVEETRAIGGQLLRASGLNAFDYLHWSDERWMPVHDRTYRINMPEPVKLPKTLSSLFGKCGF